MTSAKTLISAILIFAAAAQPVVAAIEPCCCLTKQVVQAVEAAAPACCAAKVAHPEVAKSPCCAQKQQVHSCAKLGRDAAGPIVDQAGCCCVKPAPAVPGERTNSVQRTIDTAVVDLAVGEPAPLVPAPALRRFEQLPGNHSLRGPSLLALLCVWRK